MPRVAIASVSQIAVDAGARVVGAQRELARVGTGQRDGADGHVDRSGVLEDELLQAGRRADRDGAEVERVRRRGEHAARQQECEYKLDNLVHDEAPNVFGQRRSI